MEPFGVIPAAISAAPSIFSFSRWLRVKYNFDRYQLGHESEIMYREKWIVFLNQLITTFRNFEINVLTTNELQCGAIQGIRDLQSCGDFWYNSFPLPYFMAIKEVLSYVKIETENCKFDPWSTAIILAAAVQNLEFTRAVWDGREKAPKIWRNMAKTFGVISKDKWNKEKRRECEDMSLRYFQRTEGTLRLLYSA